jgi:hypothetical protein
LCNGRVAGDDQVDHLVGAVQQYASGSHGHDLSREQVLADNGFIAFAKAVGHPASSGDPPTGGPSAEELECQMDEHHMRIVGPPMDADEAENWLGRALRL